MREAPVRTNSFKLFAGFELTSKDTCLKKWLLSFFSSAGLDLAPVLDELLTDENSTGEEVRVWSVKYKKKIICLASRLLLQLFLHFWGDTEIPLFSLYFWTLLLWGRVRGGQLQAVTNEVSQMSFHDETATSVENTALFLWGILSLTLCYREPTFLFFFILAFSRGGRFRGFQARQQDPFF